ncbi:hypothetical protein [Variovorax guangxiensis]|nr:hypothetical protein [Variovorax guangxiensis]MDR6859950.1 hypothetical protein [Variovorax guangxiensis]
MVQERGNASRLGLRRNDITFMKTLLANRQAVTKIRSLQAGV